MKKIPTIFKRNPDNMRELLRDPHPDCQWVFDGEGTATRKYDGTCVKIESGKYFKRREIKKDKPIPHKFIEEELDSITGKRVGWIEIDPAEKENKWHIEGLNQISVSEWPLPDGTYELCGPKVQGNPEHYIDHRLIRHSSAQQYPDVPRTFDGIVEWLKDKDIEGIVFQHPDGRMGKIKKRDIGQRRIRE